MIVPMPVAGANSSAIHRSEWRDPAQGSVHGRKHVSESAIDGNPVDGVRDALAPGFARIHLTREKRPRTIVAGLHLN